MVALQGVRWLNEPPTVGLVHQPTVVLQPPPARVGGRVGPFLHSKKCQQKWGRTTKMGEDSAKQVIGCFNDDTAPVGRHPTKGGDIQLAGYALPHFGV